MNAKEKWEQRGRDLFTGARPIPVRDVIPGMLVISQAFETRGQGFRILSRSKTGVSIIAQQFLHGMKNTGQPRKLSTKKYWSSGIGSGRSVKVEPMCVVVEGELAQYLKPYPGEREDAAD